MLSLTYGGVKRGSEDREEGDIVRRTRGVFANAGGVVQAFFQLITAERRNFRSAFSNDVLPKALWVDGDFIAIAHPSCSSIDPRLVVPPLLRRRSECSGNFGADSACGLAQATTREKISNIYANNRWFIACLIIDDSKRQN